jgi:hypothetical protein
MRRFIVPGLIAPLVIIFLAAAPVWADFQVTATLDNTNTLSPSAPVMINLGDGASPSVSYTPGEVNWTLVSASGITLPNKFITFCLELTQDIYLGQTYTYSVTDLASAPKPGSGATGGTSGMGPTKANKIAQLWGGFYDQIGTDGVKAAAFQLAIWKIEYDWGHPYEANLATGNFQASSPNNAAVSQATTLLKDLETHSYQTAPNLSALTSPDAQDQLVQGLPVPPTAYLAGFGVLSLLGYGYVKRRLRLVPCRVAG